MTIKSCLEVTFIVLIVLVILTGYIIYLPPKFVINLLAARYPDVLFRVITTDKIVALTIDDAPIFEDTTQRHSSNPHSWVWSLLESTRPPTTPS
eukprot:TRINITY_DN4441_c0_g2_i1.p1 TRINITY_DN4441_c0_g2~~TRINITY_DN4441_c0_g2_i1.p1  ORF type:complete len:103 (+),score=12.98 TRINITY_DN4441_c0_g2_i1:29-310(+)